MNYKGKLNHVGLRSTTNLQRSWKLLMICTTPCKRNYSLWGCTHFLCYNHRWLCILLWFCVSQQKSSIWLWSRRNKINGLHFFNQHQQLVLMPIWWSCNGHHIVSIYFQVQFLIFNYIFKKHMHSCHLLIFGLNPKEDLNALGLHISDHTWGQDPHFGHFCSRRLWFLVFMQSTVCL